MPMVLGMMLRGATVPTSSGRVLLIGAIKVPLLPVAAADGTSAMCSRSTHMPHLPEREAGQRVLWSRWSLTEGCTPPRTLGRC
jgi:hypothetical protein